MNAFLRCALLLCPAEFRRQYADAILEDAQNGNALFVTLDAIRAGIAMRIENFARACRTAVASLARARLSTFVSILSIALAIGASVAMASVLDGVLFRALPYGRPDRLVFVSQYVKNFDVVGPSFPEAQRIASDSTTLSGIAVETGAAATMLGHGVPQQINGRLVSLPYFEVLGIAPKLGRFFQAADVHSNAALISERLWRKYFNASPTVLGSTLRLKGYGAPAQAYTIVGVVPGGFRDPSPHGLRESDYWTIAQRGTAQTRLNRYFDGGIARLHDGVSIQAAQADASRIVSAFGQQSAHGRLARANLTPVLETIVGPVKPILWLLYAAVLAVLLIACANVASLNFTRLVARDQEFAIHNALGATRSRLAWQISLEAGTLAFAGTAIGIGIALLALRVFSAYGAASLPRWDQVYIDTPVLLYTAALLIFVTVVTGTLPALLRMRQARMSASRTPGESRSVKRACAAFIVIEATLCIAIAVCAGVVLRSFVTLVHTDIGINPGPNAYNVQFLPLPPGRAKDAVAKVRAIPGVVAVTASDDVPYANWTQNYTSVHVFGRSHDAAPMVEMIDTDSSYFSIMGIPVLRGRAFTAGDRMTSAPVAIVNSSFARDVLHTSSPLGMKIIPDTFAGPRAVVRTIVGVVGDVRDSRSQPAQPQFYVPLAQIGDPTQLVLRTDGHVRYLAAAMAPIFRQAAPENPPPVVVSFQDLLSQDTSSARGNTALFVALALVALVLALTGMYAVTAYATQRRTHEFGIRKAVGASDSMVLQSVLRTTLLQTCIGVCAGLIAAAFGARYLSGILYQTSPLDPLAFSGVVVVFLGCAAIATLVPALRAMRSDPVVALHYE